MKDNNMNKYRRTITADFLDGTEVGACGPHNADASLTDNPTPFSMFDDDGEHYYDGVLYGDFGGFEPLDDFGTPNAGCTEITVGGRRL